MPDKESLKKAQVKFEHLVEKLTEEGKNKAERPMNVYEREEALEALPAEDREFAQEMARFMSLSGSYFARRKKVDPEIMRTVEQLPVLPLPERIARLREINRELLERMEGAD